MLQEMGVRYEVITGDVKNKSAVAKKFQNTSIRELPVMLCQIRAGGIGLNLHKASFSIFYENEWRLQDRLQAEDRLHRIGQEKTVTIIDLVVKDSIDELVLKAVRDNKEIADFILERL
jgi:SNF2 family DNA or RNA helicase